MQSKILFVGTSSGKVSLKRFHSSLLITDCKCNVLVDAGDGVSKALLKAGINHNDIDVILISHFHADHVAGITSLLTQMKLTGRTKPLSVFATEDLVQTVKFYLYNQYIFMPNYDYTIKFCRYENDEMVKLSDNISFVTRHNSHLHKYEKFAAMGMISFDSASFMFTVNDKHILYTGDVGGKDDLYLFRDINTDIIISESMHCTPVEITEAFKKLKADKLYFTHISDEDEEKLIPFENSSSIFIASDGMEILL